MKVTHLLHSHVQQVLQMFLQNSAPFCLAILRKHDPNVFGSLPLDLNSTEQSQSQMLCSIISMASPERLHTQPSIPTSLAKRTLPNPCSSMSDSWLDKNERNQYTCHLQVLRQCWISARKPDYAEEARWKATHSEQEQGAR